MAGTLGRMAAPVAARLLEALTLEGECVEILYDKAVKFNLYVDEVYYTNSLILLVQILPCSKLHRIRAFKLKFFSYKVVRVAVR